MIDFRTHLQNRCIQIATTSVATDVKTFDNHLHDVELTQMPFMVVNVRTAEKSGESEIGVNYDLYMWTVHFYYLDIAEVYNTGDQRRNTVMSKLEKSLEEDRRLGGLDVTVNGKREYVFDSSISAALFDSSGQEEYYSFVSELYLNVYTAKS